MPRAGAVLTSHLDLRRLRPEPEPELARRAGGDRRGDTPGRCGRRACTRTRGGASPCHPASSGGRGVGALGCRALWRRDPRRAGSTRFEKVGTPRRLTISTTIEWYGVAGAVSPAGCGMGASSRFDLIIAVIVSSSVSRPPNSSGRYGSRRSVNAHAFVHDPLSIENWWKNDEAVKMPPRKICACSCYRGSKSE